MAGDLIVRCRVKTLGKVKEGKVNATNWMYVDEATGEVVSDKKKAMKYVNKTAADTAAIRFRRIHTDFDFEVVPADSEGA